MTTETAVETPPEAPVMELKEPSKPVIFATLKEAMLALAENADKSRLYRITSGQGAVKRHKVVMACSPAAAALEIVGRDNVELVSPSEKYNAAMEALMDARKDGKP